MLKSIAKKDICLKRKIFLVRNMGIIVKTICKENIWLRKFYDGNISYFVINFYFTTFVL